MALTIPVAHDFNCPWCWVGFLQARRLQREFGVSIDWRGFEIHPEWDPWPDKPSKRQPGVPTRFDLHLWAEQVKIPEVERERKMRTDKAHQAVEFAKTEAVEDALVEAIYRAYWEQGRDINDVASLRDIATGIVSDLDGMEQAIVSKAFADNIGQFDEPAYDQGVTHVPCFFIGGERYAEQQYHVLRRAVAAEMEKGPINAYAFLQYPPAPADRPYTVIDMVATIDGRIVSGSREESVQDLGSKIDHQVMKRIEKQVDAVMLGAHTLRVTPRAWNPQSKKRIVVTRSGDLPYDACFLSGGESFVVLPRTLSPSPSPSVGGGELKFLRFGEDSVDLQALLQHLRQNEAVKRLLVLGGSKLNGQLMREELVDEIFLTIAPKVKLGHDLPTIAEGEAFDRGELQRYTLIEHHVIGDEIFLRYRRTGR
jgi:riboflavin biosynthesis pyrimidine reductase/predicted DsbA family dithiol-disulfide isomerase